MNKNKYINEFNKLSIHNRIDPFFEADIDSYYEDDTEFSLVLKRSPSELSLYGEKHVNIRQAFFNKLEKNQRLAMFISKLKAAGIYDWVLESLQIDSKTIKDVIDIGKGRSIYKLMLSAGQSFVNENILEDSFYRKKVLGLVLLDHQV